MFERKDGWTKIYDAPINPEIFRLVENNKKILDVGCATGRLAERLKREKNCYVVGIEINEELAKKARERCDEVHVADIESLKELPYTPGFFDVIIFGDVLEHVRYPDKVLLKFKHYLSGEGCILLSIPNIANWTVRLNLLLGRFDYTDAGILDRTHLRFFTLKTVYQLVKESGFRVVETRANNQHLRSLGRIWKRLFAYQFVLKISEDKSQWNSE